MVEKFVYIIGVIIGAIIWLALSLWFLKKSFQGQSIATQNKPDN